MQSASQINPEKRPDRRPAWAVGLVLFGTMAIPSLIYMGGVPSMGPGILAVSIGLIYLSFMVDMHRQPWPATSAALMFILACTTLILASSGLGLLLHERTDVTRSIGSIVVFFLFMIAAYTIARGFHLLPQDIADRAVRFVFYILFMSGILGAFRISPISRIATKDVVVFVEPSHFSLSYLPLFLYITINSGARARILWIISGFAMALGLESLTLLVGTMLISLILLKTRHILLFSPLAAVVLVYLSLDYYASRLDFSEGSENISTLSFLSGWERAYLNIVDTYGLGVGFQQFGVVGKEGQVSRIIASIVGRRLAVLDGGTVGAKFVGEFGLFGILILLTYIISAVRRFFTLRTYSPNSDKNIDRKWIFFNCCFMMYSIDLFVRGIGYLAPSGLLFISSLIWIVSAEGRKPNNIKILST